MTYTLSQIGACQLVGFCPKGFIAINIFVVGGSSYLGRFLYTNSRNIDSPFNSAIWTHFQNPLPYTVKLDVGLDPSFSVLQNLTDLDYVVLLSGITEPSEVFASKEVAKRINVEGIQRLIKFIRQRNAKLLFFSSVEVFGEQNAPHSENSPTTPLNLYGKMKNANEEFIRTEFLFGNYSIIRTPWIVNPIKGSRCVISQTAKGITSGRMIFANDYLISLVSAAQVLNVLETTLTKFNKRLPNHLHIVSKGFISRFELACEVGKLLFRNKYKIQEGRFNDLKLSEQRSKDSRMVSLVTWKEPFNSPEYVEDVVARQVETMKLRGDFYG